MATSIKELVEQVGLSPAKIQSVKWNTPIDCKSEGVYIVSLSDSAESKITMEKLFKSIMEKGKYLDLWRSKLPSIISTIQKGGGEIELSSEEFQQRGNRMYYGFRLDIINGIIPTKPGDNAVARDLKKILNDSNFRKIALDKTIIICMGKQFILKVSIKE